MKKGTLLLASLFLIILNSPESIFAANEDFIQKCKTDIQPYIDSSVIKFIDISDRSVWVDSEKWKKVPYSDKELLSISLPWIVYEDIYLAYSSTNLLKRMWYFGIKKIRIRDYYSGKDIAYIRGNELKNFV